MDKYLNTKQAAMQLSRQAHTLRTYYQTMGHAYGIRPVKVGSRLHWPKDQVIRVANGQPALEAA